MRVIMNQLFTMSRTIANLTAMLVLSFQVIGSVFADEITETYDNIRIEKAYVQTDPKSQVSFLRLRISNQSTSDLTLLKIKSELRNIVD